MFKSLFLLVLFLIGGFIAAFASKKTPSPAGQQAPNFALKDQTGKKRTLAEFKGQKVALVFYPKDGSPYCTTQACSIRDDKDLYKQHNIQVIGISTDSWEKHAKFQKEHNLWYLLLSDPSGSTINIYGAKGWFGYASRKTVLIDENGFIVNTLSNINFKTQAQDILKKFGYTK